MIDFEKLDAVLQHIKDNPRQHDQSYFGIKTECGTTACFAGWTMLLFAPDEVKWEAISSDFELVLKECGAIGPAAAKILGLTTEQHDFLFYHAMNLPVVETAIKELHNNPQATFGDLHFAVEVTS